jgi:hypothetical protein
LSAVADKQKSDDDSQDQQTHIHVSSHHVPPNAASHLATR